MLSIFLALIDEPSDRELFTEIYEQYQKQMFLVANKILRDKQLAEDATQNAFLRIAINIKSLRKLDKIQTRYYLLISAKNAALDIDKKRKKHQTVSIDAFYPSLNESSADTIEHFEDNDYIIQLLKKLPDKYTDVMYLRYVTNLSEIEIAGILDRKINTVRQQVARGKKMFVELYEKEKLTNGR